MPLSQEVNLDEYAKLTDGLSGAETSLICREAGLKALTFENKIEKLNNQSDMLEFRIEKHFIDLALLEVRNRGKKNNSLF